MNKKNKGILFIICSAFCFALMGMFVKLAGDLPSIEKSFFRNLVALLFALIILKKDHVHFSGKKENIKYLVIRSVAGTVGILCNFYAVDHLVLSDASMLNKMSPFFARFCRGFCPCPAWGILARTAKIRRCCGERAQRRRWGRKNRCPAQGDVLAAHARARRLSHARAGFCPASAG